MSILSKPKQYYRVAKKLHPNLNIYLLLLAGCVSTLAVAIATCGLGIIFLPLYLTAFWGVFYKAGRVIRKVADVASNN